MFSWLKKKKNELPSVLEKIEEHDSYVYILVKGVNDKSTIPTDQIKWEPIVKKYHMEDKNIVFDMGDVTAIDSAALAIILNAVETLKKNQHFVLINATEQFLNLSDIQKVRQKMEICNSLDDALQIIT